MGVEAAREALANPSFEFGKSKQSRCPVINSVRNKKILGDYFLAFWIIFSFATAISPRNVILNFAYGVVSFILLVAVTRLNSKSGWKVVVGMVFAYLFTTAIPLLRALFDGRISIIYYWVIGLNTLLAIRCLRDVPSQHLLLIARILIFVCFIVAALVVREGHADIDSVAFLGGSSNLLSAALIAVVCWYCYVQILSGRTEPIFIPLALLMFTVFLGGRSGIVISFGICLISICFRASRSRASLLLGFLFAIILAWMFSGELLSDLVSGTRLKHGFYDDVRDSMIDEYLEGMGLTSFWLGKNFDPSGIIAEYEGNPHNSFIRAHHLFGVLPIVIFAVMLAAAAIRLTQSPSRVTGYGFLLGLMILLRSYYDSVTFWFELDFAVLSLLFSPILLASHQSKSNCLSASERHSRVRP